MKRWLLLLVIAVFLLLTESVEASWGFRPFTNVHSPENRTPSGVKRWLLITKQHGLRARTYKAVITEDYQATNTFFITCSRMRCPELFGANEQGNYSIGAYGLIVDNRYTISWRVVAYDDPCLKEWKEAECVNSEWGPC